MRTVAAGWMLIALVMFAAPLPGVDAAPSAGQRFVIVPGESQVIYRVSEVFINESNRFNVAVGVTSAVRGEIIVDRANPASSRIGPIQVDVSQFRSDSARRDNAIRRWWLESSRFPVAEFAPVSVEGLPAAYTDGRDLNVRIRGDLRVRDVVRRTVFDATLKLTADTLTGTAAATVRMTDFGFDPPAILGVLRADNEVRIEFRFIARPASGS